MNFDILSRRLRRNDEHDPLLYRPYPENPSRLPALRGRLLPFLLREGCNNIGIKEKVLILVATSGDTGKAALEGFKDAEGIKIMVFYPSEGVSDMQKLQMCTQEGENVSVVAVKGNFDDCQSAVKRIFNDADCIESLKKQGKFDIEAQKEAFNMTSAAVLEILSAEAKEYLTEAIGDLNAYVAKKIEAEVNNNKK